MMTASSISREHAIDAEFETVSAPSKPLRTVQSPHQKSPHHKASLQNAIHHNAPVGLDGLALLRENSGTLEPRQPPDELSPAFLIATMIAALVVFWVSGGHSLLY